MKKEKLTTTRLAVIEFAILFLITAAVASVSLHITQASEIKFLRLQNALIRTELNKAYQAQDTEELKYEALRDVMRTEIISNYKDPN